MRGDLRIKRDIKSKLQTCERWLMWESEVESGYQGLREENGHSEDNRLSCTQLQRQRNSFCCSAPLMIWCYIRKQASSFNIFGPNRTISEETSKMNVGFVTQVRRESRPEEMSLLWCACYMTPADWSSDRRLSRGKAELLLQVSGAEKHQCLWICVQDQILCSGINAGRNIEGYFLSSIWDHMRHT